MANRHLARSIVLQTLYEWDFRNLSEEDSMLILARNVKEFAPKIKDDVFTKSLIKDVIRKKKDLDIIIEKAAPDWPIDKISLIDRNILRVGLAELLFSDKDEVPPKVAINEAIEIAKTFGGDTSGKFINGVLGAVYKEMGEPGKDYSAPRKKNFNDVSDEDAPVDRLVGAVVYCLDNNGILNLALVHDVFGHWTLSKGHLIEKEKIDQGVRRIVKEELGLLIEPENEIGGNEYIAFDPEKGKLRKKVTFVLARSDYVDFKLLKKGGLDDARWFEVEKIADLNFYDDVLPIIIKALEVLTGRESK